MPTEFARCDQCGTYAATQDLKPCLGYMCCLACRNMTRQLALSAGTTRKSLPEFARHVMRHAATRTNRPYQLSMAQLRFRKGQGEGA